MTKKSLRNGLLSSLEAAEAVLTIFQSDKNHPYFTPVQALLEDIWSLKERIEGDMREANK